MVPQFAYALGCHRLEERIMTTRLTADRPRVSKSAGRMSAAAAFAIVLALAALIYWQLDPVRASRETYAACAGQAAAQLHAPDPDVRQRAIDTLTECASHT
jgi:ferric-dicitrate binding protein FerR (iron transport regulator)